MPDPSGLSEDYVRGKIKDAFREGLRNRMFGELDGNWKVKRAFSAEESVLEMQRITRQLNPSDQGNLTESWYQRYRSTFEKELPTLSEHPALPRGGDLAPRKPDFAEGDLDVDGTTLVEVKSSKKGLTAKREVPQLRDYLNAARARAKVDVGASKKAVNDVRVVFTNPEGAWASQGKLKEFWQEYKNLLSVEVFVAGEKHIVSSFKDFESLMTASTRTAP